MNNTQKDDIIIEFILPDNYVFNKQTMINKFKGKIKDLHYNKIIFSKRGLIINFNTYNTVKDEIGRLLLTYNINNNIYLFREI